jgi:hypothetical protein
VPAGAGNLTLSKHRVPVQKGTFETKGNGVRVRVEPGGPEVAAHVGLHVKGAFANRLDLGDSLSFTVI